MKDVTQGLMLFTLSILAMIGYFWAVFLADNMLPNFNFLGRSIGEWALIIPILIIVYLFLFIVAWIGWTMATTPPPLPIQRNNSQNRGCKKESV
ncbi:MAG: transcriptional regulator [Candidatus Bathyarchaeia archaeon]